MNLGRGTLFFQGSTPLKLSPPKISTYDDLDPEYRSLLDAVVNRSDDDLPRYAMADWLAEHGDEGRAEFIRYQLATGESIEIRTDAGSRFGLNISSDGTVFRLPYWMAGDRVLFPENQTWTASRIVLRRGFLDEIQLESLMTQRVLYVILRLTPVRAVLRELGASRFPNEFIGPGLLKRIRSLRFMAGGNEYMTFRGRGSLYSCGLVVPAQIYSTADRLRSIYGENPHDYQLDRLS